jgi:hypothetical protein
MDDNLERRAPFSPFRLILNCLTLVILLATLGVGVVLAFVFINPYSAINPYPPPTLPPTLGPPTATNTPQIFLPTSWTSTPSVTFTPTETETPTPPATLTPSATLGTVTPAGAAFGLQPGSPVAIPNIANNDQCNWMGVGGQVFDLDDSPIPGQPVRIDGTLAGQLVLIDTLTGSAPALGPAGYVFNLSDHPIASQGTLFIQLRDNQGIPLSERIPITTFDTCDKNLVLVNWKRAK